METIDGVLVFHFGSSRQTMETNSSEFLIKYQNLSQQKLNLHPSGIRRPFEKKFHFCFRRIDMSKEHKASGIQKISQKKTGY